MKYKSWAPCYQMSCYYAECSKNEHFLPEENYRTGTSNEMDKTNYHPLDFKEHHRSKIPLPCLLPASFERKR